MNNEANLRQDLKDTQELATELTAEVKKLKAALRKVKPIVGAAVAAASNEARPLRQAAYDQLCKALE